MTDRPWQAELEVSVELAAQLVETQFPELAPARVRPIGVGWDNVALELNEAWIFRFPRRSVAVELLANECATLPRIAAHVPLAVPVPDHVGVPTARFPWPFAGYRKLPGTSACGHALPNEARLPLAAPLARFLRALHAIPVATVPTLPADTWRRLDVEYRIERLNERLAAAVGSGLLASAAPWQALIDATPRAWQPADAHIVHGDFYARHVLLDETGAVSGVIDWGDVHRGDPAVDLSIAHSFLPHAAHAEFLDVYGPVDEERWRVARFKALFSATMLVTYGSDVGDTTLVREGLTSLERLRVGPS